MMYRPYSLRSCLRLSHHRSQLPPNRHRLIQFLPIPPPCPVVLISSISLPPFICLFSFVLLSLLRVNSGLVLCRLFCVMYFDHFITPIHFIHCSLPVFCFVVRETPPNPIFYLRNHTFKLMHSYAFSCILYTRMAGCLVVFFLFCSILHSGMTRFVPMFCCLFPVVSVHFTLSHTPKPVVRSWDLLSCCSHILPVRWVCSLALSYCTHFCCRPQAIGGR